MDSITNVRFKTRLRDGSTGGDNYFKPEENVDNTKSYKYDATHPKNILKFLKANNSEVI